MKKISFLCLVFFLVSCSQNDEWQDISTSEINKLSDELESIKNSKYELLLKGYSSEYLSKEKDEKTPTTQEETSADPWLIKVIQDSLTASSKFHYGRTRSDASAYANNSPMVGVFRFDFVTGCGTYREFVYFMDCEDGGDTHYGGDIGSTQIDGNGNVTFRFCIVPAGNYGGGTLLLYNYTWGVREGAVDVIARYHDNEDHGNKNSVQNHGGLSSTGLSSFGGNTNLYWRFSLNNELTQSLPISYGVLSNYGPNTGTPYIFIDDENGSNSNDATLWTHRTTGINGVTHTRKLGNGETYRGIKADRNTIYYIERRH